MDIVQLREVIDKGMGARIIILGDLHYGEPSLPERGEMAPLLLRRAVDRIEKFIRPDAVLVLGDLIDDEKDAKAGEKWAELREILDELSMPSIVLPGNHDGDPASFYRVFERPPEWVDIHDVRFLPFVDPSAPEWNARREDYELERFAHARKGFLGTLVSVQHVPLVEPGQGGSRFGYVNMDAIREAAVLHGVTLSLSGHEHRGVDTTHTTGLRSIATPAFDTPPFTFLEVRIEKESVRVLRHDLALPESLRLFDWHVHSPFAFCGHGLDFATEVRIAKDFGLAGFGFSEHSGQLYFTKKANTESLFYTDGIEYAEERNSRIGDYFEMSRALAPEAAVGLEVDCDVQGRVILLPEDRERSDFLLGALHYLSEFRHRNPSYARLFEEFLDLTDGIASSGIDVLAHPFRIFLKLGLTIPEFVYEEVVDILSENGVAMELSFGAGGPPAPFIRQCLERGVKIAFGSDSHELYQIGDLAPHVSFLRHAVGFNGDLGDVLLPPPRVF
jgi:histidinol phosphatase-like PHP family hydrolase/calcineurin-like phosphoesterase family protein